ncbi:MAG: DnaD domain protein [Clostridia bacterium]|nr:DnaD domain protein [Clostridia bacterium]
MKYSLNAMAMNTPFFVPSSVVDRHIKLASANQIKVLLVFLKNVSIGITAEQIAEFLRLPLSEVTDALDFWAEREIVIADGKKAEEKPQEKPAAKAVRSVAIKPTREEISAAAQTDDRIAFLISEAEMKLARGLRYSEIRSLCWLYLDHGMDVSLILMLVEYAVSEGKATVSFIESTALAWLQAGVSTLTDAEEQIEIRNKRKTAWGIVLSAFGMEYRMPSDKELEFSGKWVAEWGFKADLLKEAYNICVDKNAKVSMPYINKILEKWHKDGMKTVEETKTAAKAKASKNGFGAYDKSLVEKLLNSDD